MKPQTLYDKLFDSHVVSQERDGTALLYVDRHYLHEVTSAQPFEGLRLAGRKPWRESSALLTADHNTPTKDWDKGIADPVSRLQVETLDRNARSIEPLAYFPFRDPRQGVVHVVGPEMGATLPGMSVVCGDSHTSTHGAFAALAFGVGTSEVELALATQCVVTRKMRPMLVRIDGELRPGVSAKDMALSVIAQIGASGGTGCAIEFAGSAVESLSMEGRMTLCNMAIEAGARSGLVAVDDKTVEYLRGRPFAPQGEEFGRAEAYWRSLRSDEGAAFDKTVALDAQDMSPMVTWGTTPEMATTIDGAVPSPDDCADPVKRSAVERALSYMGLRPGQKIADIPIDAVFIGSCTNGRIEDLRAAAAVLKGKKIAPNVKKALVVPGSGAVRRQAQEEGLDRVFAEAGFEFRMPGCSMCLAMNDDKLEPKERCASTSNRNFEGRQGNLGRTHLLSPAMAAAAAIAGRFADAREFA